MNVPPADTATICKMLLAFVRNFTSSIAWLHRLAISPRASPGYTQCQIRQAASAAGVYTWLPAHVYASVLLYKIAVCAAASATATTTAKR
jgi:hypothetical protein